MIGSPQRINKNIVWEWREGEKTGMIRALAISVLVLGGKDRQILRVHWQSN